jgi:hypothetical protein
MPSRKNVTIGITINLDNYENLRLEVSGDAEDAGGMEELIAFLDTLLLRLGHGDLPTAERVESYRRRVLQRSTLPPGAVAAARAKASLQGVARQPGSAPAAPPAPARAAAPQPAARQPAEPAPAPVAERPSKTAVMGVDLPPSPLDEIVAASDAAASRRQGAAAAPRAMTMEDVVLLEEEAEKEAVAQGPAAKGGRKAPEPAAAPRGKEAAPKGKKSPAPPAAAGVPSPEAASPPEPEPAGDVLCQECGEPVGKSQQKLSQLFMGKVLCRKCMNP